MKKNEQTLMTEAQLPKQKETKEEKQYLYNLLFNGRISLKEYLEELKRTS